jgi:hypothetical protein
MDQSEDTRELERKIEQASRIASSITDQTTIERLRGWVEELRQSLRQRLAARRAKEAIKHALGNSGSKTVVPQAATWSSGFQPSLKSRRANGKCEVISRALCLDRPRSCRSQLP